jgi:hypothetical protein
VIAPPIRGRHSFGSGRDDGSDLLPGGGRGDPEIGGLPGIRNDSGGRRGNGRGSDPHGGEGRHASGEGPGGRGGEPARDSVADALAEVTQARERQAQQLVALHRDVIEPDELGRPVVRGEVLALAPTPAALAKAEKAGFRIRSRDRLPELGMDSVVLTAPPRTSAVVALRRLRALDPQGRYDLNNIYQEGGAVAARAKVARAPAAASAAPASSGVRVGLVDGGVAADQPAFASAHLVQRGFAPGGLKVSAHGTAVASLIAGRAGVFRGAAPGASLFVADVYGATPVGGSAETIVRALAWLAQSGVPVINISLVGPPNLLLATAVKNLIARGRIVVAAVGNDGPAAPPLYPASYPGVVAVTGVDPRWRVLPEASKSTHVDFAAPGSDMAAAGLGGGFVSVRGTSFSAPIAAGLLAKLISRPDRAAAERAVSVLGRRALDLGPRGPDALYGRGVVGSELRVPPGAGRARAALRGP